MTKLFSDDTILIGDRLSDLLIQLAKENKILTTDWLNSTPEEKQKYNDFLRSLFIMPSVLTEKGIAAFNEGVMELAGAMFSQAVQMDNEYNDYWQSYFCKWVYEVMSGKKEDAAKTFAALKKKNPLFDKQMDNIWARMTDVATDKAKAELKEFFGSI